MTTSASDNVSLLAEFLTSPSATSPSQPPGHTGPSQSSVFSPAKEARLAGAVFFWDELWEVRRVEQVMAPLVVTLIAVSNLTLLVHEARLVWRTQRLIQPKLLVVALCSADLMTTLVGFLPLWILFELPQESTLHGLSLIHI